MTLAIYTTEVMADSPWGFWKMQETSGTAMADSSGGSHDGTYNASAASVAGPMSGWTAINALTSSATITGVPSQNTPMCFEWWSMLSQGGSTTLPFAYGDNARAYGIESTIGGLPCSLVNTGIQFLNPSVTWVCATHAGAIDGFWTHNVIQLESDGHWRAYARRGTMTSPYIDDLGTTVMVAPPTPSIGIGHRPGGAGGNQTGYISAFAFYTHALTPARIAAHWDAAQATVAPSPCQYGTRAKATSPIVAVLQEAALAALAEGLGLNWLETMILVAAGQQIDVNALCQSLPPTPPPPTPEALNYPPYKILEWVYPLIWNTYCECVPGVPLAPKPPDPTWTKPPGWQDPRVIIVNPTNPCLDLTEVRRMLDTVIRQTNIDVQLDTLMQRYGLPFATVRGATHSGLSGYGSFAISRLIGVQITITSRNPGRELEGAPQYVWDLGWASCMDGNGFIQERRITRDVEVWMPRNFQEATTFGYMFKEGVVASVTELQAET